MKKTLPILLLFLLVLNGLYSQIGPNITTGANGVIFNKGKIETERLIEIIATKKGEVKSELAKRLILKKFNNANFATYNYVRQNIEMLLSDANVDVKSQLVLKSSAELVMVYGFAELYLQKVVNEENKTDAEKNFLIEMRRWVNDTDGQEKNENIPKKLPTMKVLKKYINKNGSYSESDGKNVSPTHIYIDMIYDILKESSYVTKMDFFNEIGVTDTTYKIRSKYFKFRDPKYINTEKSIDIYKNINGIRDDIKKQIEIYFKYYYLFNKLKEIETPTSYTNLDIAFDSLPSNCISIIIAGNNKNNKTLSEKEELLIQETYLFLTKLKNPDNENFDNYAYHLKKELLPQLITLNINQSGEYSELIESMDIISTKLFNNSLKKLIEEDNDCDISNIKDYISFFSENYSEILQVINNLDDVSSYDKIFNFLGDIENIISDKKTKAVLHEITEYFNKYITIDREENLLTIDVENIGVDLYKKFGENNSSRVSMYFTMGISNSYSSISSALNSSNNLNKELLNDETINYASEKLGIEWKILDFNKRSTFNYSNEGFDYKGYSPLINNWHLIGYTSGLLYQIDFLNSSPNTFSSPIYGISTGITFFNGLDANIGYIVPYDEKFNKGFLTVSFDIKITEYLSKIKKK